MKLQHYKPQEVWLVFQIPETLPICGTVRRIYQIQREFYSKHKLHLESPFLDTEKQQGPEDVPWKWHPGSLFRDSHLSHSHRNQPHKGRYGSSGTHLHYSIWNFFSLSLCPGCTFSIVQGLTIITGSQGTTVIQSRKGSLATTLTQNNNIVSASHIILSLCNNCIIQ